MSNLSAIEWTDKTLNPIRGCSRVSPGCLNCYMFDAVETRLRHNPSGAYANGTAVTLHLDVLDHLGRDREPSRYFICSMSDWLHEDVPDEAVVALVDALRRHDHHWYFLLTKRAERLAELGPYLAWPDHVIACVSVESEEQVHRIDLLRACGAKRIGVSAEPLIGRLPLGTEAARARYIRGLDYVIVGGETAPEGKVRPMAKAWATGVRDACLAEGVPFHFKQWGDVDEHGDYVGHKKAGRLLGGRTHDDLARGCAEHLERARLLAAAGSTRRSASRSARP
ncbi:MAG: DUF5131 family protein [Rhodothermales bacterium]